MSMPTRFPVTPAITALKEADAEYREHLYAYRRAGAEVAAEELGVGPSLVVKTFVMEDDRGEPFIVLMHGDREVSTREIARAIGAKSVSPCSLRDAQRHTGYKVGGISPFGTKRELPVYVEESILSLPRLFINAGRRGFVVEMSPSELIRLLKPALVRVARRESDSIKENHFSVRAL
jgi:Cys-tRNA(Pro) deacylase